MYWDEKGQSWLVKPEEYNEYNTRLWKKFLKYDEQNPQYWQEFCKRAYEFIDKGYDRIGAKLITETIRWDEECRRRKISYNFSNDFHAYYARKFLKIHPQYKDLFELRPVKRD